MHQNFGQVQTLTYIFILVLSTLKDASPAKVLIQMSVSYLLYLYRGLPCSLGFTVLQSWFHLKRCVFQNLETQGKNLDLSQFPSLLHSGSCQSLHTYILISPLSLPQTKCAFPFLGLTPELGRNPEQPSPQSSANMSILSSQELPGLRPQHWPRFSQGIEKREPKVTLFLPPSTFYQIQQGSLLKLVIQQLLNNRNNVLPKAIQWKPKRLNHSNYKSFGAREVLSPCR